jgi:hypothetical protein
LHANPAPAAGARPAGFGGRKVGSVLGCPPPSRGLRDEGHEGEDNPTPPPGRPGGLPPGEEGMNERRADGPRCRRRAEVRPRWSKARGSGAAPQSPPRKGDRRRRRRDAATRRLCVCLFYSWCSFLAFLLDELWRASRPSGRCPSRSRFRFRCAPPRRIGGALGFAATRGLANARSRQLSSPKIAVLWMKE